MERAVERGPDWVGVPVIATVARLLCRELTLQNEYLRLENLQGWYGLGLIVACRARRPPLPEQPHKDGLTRLDCIVLNS
jgi:hypothetical protein